MDVVKLYQRGESLHTPAPPLSTLVLAKMEIEIKRLLLLFVRDEFYDVVGVDLPAHSTYNRTFIGCSWSTDRPDAGPVFFSFVFLVRTMKNKMFGVFGLPNWTPSGTPPPPRRQMWRSFDLAPRSRITRVLCRVHAVFTWVSK